jgi:hypothetical protein
MNLAALSALRNYFFKSLKNLYQTYFLLLLLSLYLQYSRIYSYAFLVHRSFAMVATEGKESEKQVPWESLQLSGYVYDNYMNNITAEVTKYNYTFAIKKFMQSQGVNRIEDLLPPNSNSSFSPPTYADIKLIESRIMSYVSERRMESAVILQMGI